MKRIGYIYEQIYDYENLYKAYLNARKDKRYRKEVLQFSHNLEENLIQIQNELVYETYVVGKYREFFVYSPKKRLIMALPFKDRVTQWAIYQIIESDWNSRFIYHTYACRKGKGSHKAVASVQNQLRRMERAPGKTYYLSMDVSKFFYQVDHGVMMAIFARRYKDKRLLSILRLLTIPDDERFGIPLGDHFYEQERLEGIGMPIGDLLSQLRAGIYLNEIDQHIKHAMRVETYWRYMDDFLILSKSKKELNAVLEEVELFLNFELKLQLNNKTRIAPATGGIDFVGYRIWSSHIKVRKDTAKRITKACKFFRKAFANGWMSAEDVRVRLMSYMGVLKHANAYGFLKKLLKILTLTRERKGDDV